MPCKRPTSGADSDVCQHVVRGVCSCCWLAAGCLWLGLAAGGVRCEGCGDRRSCSSRRRPSARVALRSTAHSRTGRRASISSRAGIDIAPDARSTHRHPRASPCRFSRPRPRPRTREFGWAGTPTAFSPRSRRAGPVPTSLDGHSAHAELQGLMLLALGSEPLVVTACGRALCRAIATTPMVAERTLTCVDCDDPGSS
jgi:hypothetical protein